MKNRRYFVVAKVISICGWYVEAENLKAAREKAQEGPAYRDLDFDEPDDFEITKVMTEKRRKHE